MVNGKNLSCIHL